MQPLLAFVSLVGSTSQEPEAICTKHSISIKAAKCKASFCDDDNANRCSQVRHLCSKFREGSTVRVTGLRWLQG